MKFLKIAAFSLTIVAICFTGAVFYIISNAPNSQSITLPVSKNDLAQPTTPDNDEIQNVKDQMEERLATIETRTIENTDPISEQPVSIQQEQETLTVDQMPEPEPISEPYEPYSEGYVTSPSAPASVLIIGRWQSANNPNGYFEFFQDGTFTRGNYRSTNSFSEFSGTYSFSSDSRLKLQYEKWSVGTESGYRNTRQDDTSHVFDISIDDNKLYIPEAEEIFGTMEWTRVD